MISRNFLRLHRTLRFHLRTPCPPPATGPQPGWRRASRYSAPLSRTRSPVTHQPARSGLPSGSPFFRGQEAERIINSLTRQPGTPQGRAGQGRALAQEAWRRLRQRRCVYTPPPQPRGRVHTDVCPGLAPPAGMCINLASDSAAAGGAASLCCGHPGRPLARGPPQRSRPGRG